MKLVIVKNMPGGWNGCDYRHIQSLSGMPEKCRSFHCIAKAETYSHVVVVDDSEKKCFIVAFCVSCSKKEDLFLVWQHALIADTPEIRITNQE